MILVDTSIWIDHLRRADRTLSALLEGNSVLGHPWVIGELALGTLRDRAEVLARVGRLEHAVVASPREIVAMIDAHALDGCGIGFVDAGLLASARITPDTVLWSRDRRLAATAERIGVAFAAAS